MLISSEEWDCKVLTVYDINDDNKDDSIIIIIMIMIIMSISTMERILSNVKKR